MNGTVLFTLVATLCCAPAFAAEKLTYVDLVQRLTDLDHLATLPARGETTKQWSSYDRASQYDEANGKYVRWDANGDGHGIIRREGNQQVLAEMDGPGVIWRIWSATPKSGRVRIYLDGDSEPAVDLPFAGYFDRKNAPFTRPNLVHTTARGWNNYTPIPYLKSCRIVADNGWGDYFQFVYTTFPKETELPTFKRELSARENDALDEAEKRLSSCGPRGTQGGTLRSKGDLVVMRANGGVIPGNFSGPAAIALIRAKVDLPPSPADRDPLRELVLEIKWDGESKASVWTPLGDFFGTAPGANVYRSLPCGRTEDGWFYANWYMPFAKSAEVTLRNDGAREHRVRFEVYTVPLEGEVSKYGRFHAKWHRDEFLPTEPERWIDWPMLKTTGRGRFAGVMLHIWNPRGGWWGEGDEKFFVDGERFPSTIGTGSEDYFGYAWCCPELFSNAFHNQTCNDGNNKGHVSVNRWHVADQIPFYRSLDAYIEKYYPNARPTLYASTVYWYLEPGGDDPYSPVPLRQRTSYYVQPAYKTIPGAVEGEQMKILSKTGGNPQEQDMTPWGGERWSRDAHLWWINAKPGDQLVLTLPVAKPGRYEIEAHLTKARDYGIVQLSLDGRKLGSPIDLYDPQVVPTGAIKLGTFELTPGDHKLTVEITGANEEAVKSYMFGLDYLKLTPTD